MTTHQNYHIRQLRTAELELYRNLRLEALQTEPGVFGNSYEMEAAFTPEQWLARVTNPRAACFGLFCNQELVGITGITCSAERPDEAYLSQSYIRAGHRGKGLARLLYEARINWARTHGVRYLVVGHRESNLVSKAANQRFGFTYTHRESRTWPDGVTEDMLYYRREI